MRVLLLAVGLLVWWLWLGPQHTRAESKGSPTPSHKASKSPIKVEIDEEKRVIRAEAPAPDVLIQANRSLKWFQRIAPAWEQFHKTLNAPDTKAATK